MCGPFIRSQQDDCLENWDERCRFGDQQEIGPTPLNNKREECCLNIGTEPLSCTYHLSSQEHTRGRLSQNREDEERTK